MSVIPDGERWRCQFYYKDWYGEKHRKNKRGFNTKKETQEWEEEFLKKYNMKYILFKDFVNLYLEDQKGRIRDTTMEGKINIIDTKILPFFGEKELHSIQPLEIRKWQNKLLKMDYSQTYVRTINNQLAVLFHFAERFYDLESNPCRKAGTIGLSKAEEMNYWEKEEFDKFLVAVKDNPTSYLIFEILFWPGMRIGELLELTQKDIDLDKRTISINKCLVRLKGRNVIHTPKTSRGKRTISIPVFLTNDIEEYLSKLYGIMEYEQIFKVTKSYMEHEMERGYKLSGVKRIRLHDLRHSHASLLINMGVEPIEIKNRLGHERIYTTIDSYYHLYPDKQREISYRLNALKDNNTSNSIKDKDDGGDSDGGVVYA